MEWDKTNPFFTSEIKKKLYLQYERLWHFKPLRKLPVVLDWLFSNDSFSALIDAYLSRLSAQNHRSGTELDGSSGGGGGLGSHVYLHNTPADFKWVGPMFFNQVIKHFPPISFFLNQLLQKHPL